MGTNPNIFENKQNRRTVPDGEENFFITADELKQIDTEFENRTTPEEVVNLFPQNHPTQLGLIDVGGNNVATVVEPSIPLTGTVISFRHPAKFGSWKAPLSTLTLSLTEANGVTVTVYLESPTIPAQIVPDNIKILDWEGDAFDGTAGVVNKLEITYVKEPVPQNYFIEIHNTTKVISGVDPLLRLYYKFEEEVGFENDFIDQTGYANNGVMIEGSAGLGTPSTSARGIGVNGQSLLSVDNGSTSTNVELVEIPHDSSIAVDGDFSVSFWLKATNFANISGIFSKDVTSAGSSGIAIWLDTDGRIQTRINNATSSAGRLYSIGTIPLGTWKHVTYTHQRGVEAKIYIDGVLDNTLTTTILLNVLSDNAYIGVNNPINFITRGLRLGDELDELKFWKKQLSDAEVLAEYNIYAP